MACKHFTSNDFLYRSCHKNHYDSKKHIPKFSAFLPRKVDGNYSSVQCQAGREKNIVLQFFFDNFSDHVGYFKFSVDDCTSKGITCCDDTDPPNDYHSKILFDSDHNNRIYTAKVLLKISEFDLY
jgi:hypothetical protein